MEKLINRNSIECSVLIRFLNSFTGSRIREWQAIYAKRRKCFRLICGTGWKSFPLKSYSRLCYIITLSTIHIAPTDKLASSERSTIIAIRYDTGKPLLFAHTCRLDVCRWLIKAPQKKKKKLHSYVLPRSCVIADFLFLLVYLKIN